MPNLYALLIGINYYLPNLLPDGLFFKNLNGCVADVLLVDHFLRTRIGLSAANITRLTSSVVGDKEPVEDPSQWPTYENIVNAFKRLTETAAPGDQIFIHYSGHGNRTQTTKAFRHVKKLDEVLVPMDIGNPEHRYLRDTELHFLLRAMVDRGLVVTLALDSCHAASGTRSVQPDWNQTAVRRGNKTDETVRELNSLVASERELLSLWEKSSEGKTRKAEVGSGWLLDPKGYTLLAACGSTEEANEHAFDGKQTHGALTYWMVEALQQIGPGFTYRVLLDNVLANIHSQFASQTPQLEGEGNRVVFGAGEVPTQRGITVLKLFGDGTVLLNAGEAHGLKAGVCFNIFPLRETNLGNSERRICQVEVTEVLPLQSRARIVDGHDAQTLQAGCQAMTVDAGRMRLGRRVRLLTSRNGSAGSSDAAVLAEITDAIAQQSGPFITVASKEDVPDYFVTVNNSDEYVICDPAGREIPNLRPALSISREAVPAVVQRLVHLNRYASVQQLDNNSPQSPLARKVEVKLMGEQENYVRGEKPEPKRFKGRAIVKNGAWVILRVRNRYAKPIHVTVLDLQCDWAITQIYPSGAGAFETIDPRDELILPLHMTLPAAYEGGTDVIKVFATVEPTSFRCLEMPALDQPPLANVRGGPGNKLEKFLSVFTPTTTNARLATIPINAETLWTAHQVEIEVRR